MPIDLTGVDLGDNGSDVSVSSNMGMTGFVRCRQCGFKQAQPLVGKFSMTRLCPQCGSGELNVVIGQKEPAWFNAP